MPQVSQKRPFVKAFAGKRKAPGSLRRKPLPMRMLWKLEVSVCWTRVKVLAQIQRDRAAYRYSERASSAKRVILNVGCCKARTKRLERGMPYTTLPVLGGVQCEESFCA